VLTLEHPTERGEVKGKAKKGTRESETDWAWVSSITVLAYFYPTGEESTDWERMYGKTTCHRIILDCDFGTLNPLDNKYINNPKQFYQDLPSSWGTRAPDLVNTAQNHEMRVFGYVPTDGATAANGYDLEPKPADITEAQWRKKDFRSLNHIKKYVDFWYDWPSLRIDGIFFDEGPMDWRFKGGPPNTIPHKQYVHPDVRQFYQEIHGYVKSKQSVPNVRGTTVMLNASEFKGEWVMSTADTVLLYEGTSKRYEDTEDNYVQYILPEQNSWNNGQPYPQGRKYHVIHSCPHADMPRMIGLSRQRNVSNVYVYDGSSEGYNRLPSYWEGENVVVNRYNRL